jgi:osmotically-inducible protein OsmY
MANQNGRAYPDRNAQLRGYHPDDDRDRGAVRRDDDRAFGERDDPERSWRPEDRGERDDRGFERGHERRFGRGLDRSFDQSFDQNFDRRYDRRFDERPYDRPDDADDRPRWQQRPERFSESDRGREPYGVRDREDRGEGRELRVDIQTPRQDQLLRGAYRDHDESSRDLSYRAGPPHAEPAGPRGRMPGARGPHAGKGPVGFQRSDDRVRELVCEALTDDGEVDASRIEVTVKAGEVTLTGAIEDRRMKRLAEDCVEAVPGVKDVHNQLRIGPADRGGHADKHERHGEPSDKKHRPS